MSVFERLPKRKDGTNITPWDSDWTNDVRGVYDAHWGRVGMDEVTKAKRDVPDPVKTGEMVDPGLMRMFVKDAYKALFDRLYVEE